MGLIRESVSTRVFERRTTTGREHFACQDSGVSQTFILIISNGEKILGNVNVVVRRQGKRENSSLPVAVGVPKPRVPKLPSLPEATSSPGSLFFPSFEREGKKRDPGDEVVPEGVLAA